MSARRAVVRLWVLGSLAWIAFWTWNYTAHCLRTADGGLWCPTVFGGAIGRVDRWHMALVLFGPPLVSCIGGLFCLWAVRASRRWL